MSAGNSRIRPGSTSFSVSPLTAAVVGSLVPLPTSDVLPSNLSSRFTLVCTYASSALSSSLSIWSPSFLLRSSPTITSQLCTSSVAACNFSCSCSTKTVFSAGPLWFASYVIDLAGAAPAPPTSPSLTPSTGSAPTPQLRSAASPGRSESVVLLYSPPTLP